MAHSLVLTGLATAIPSADSTITAVPIGKRLPPSLYVAGASKPSARFKIKVFIHRLSGIANTESFAALAISILEDVLRIAQKGLTFALQFLGR